MTITNQTNKTRQEGNGTTKTFSFSFLIFKSEDLKIYIIKKDVSPEVPVLLTETTDYTVSINDSSEGGDVTLNVAPTIDEDVFIIRQIEYVQETDIGINVNFPETNVENEFDKSRMLDIQNKESIDRTLKLNEYFVGSIDLTLTDPEGGKVIGYNFDASKLINYSSSDLDTILTSSYGKGLVQTADVDDARDYLNLGLSGNVSFTTINATENNSDTLNSDTVNCDDINISNKLNRSYASETIVGNAINYTASIIRVDDGTIHTINGGTVGDILTLRAPNGETIIQDENMGGGNIALRHDGQLKLDFNSDFLHFVRSDTAWLCTGRSLRHEVLELVESVVDISNDAVVDFTWDDEDDKYDHFFLLRDVLPQTDDVDFRCRFSYDVGSTFKSSSYYENCGVGNLSRDNTAYTNNSNLTDKVTLNLINHTLSNESFGGISGLIKCINPSNSASYKHINYDVEYVYHLALSEAMAMSKGSANYQNETDPINGIRFYFSSGNLLSGQIIHYKKRRI